MQLFKLNMADNNNSKDHLPEYFKSGPLPVDKRSCTDILCCLIFFCFTGKNYITIIILSCKYRSSNLCFS